jgi:hypothetical protein
MAGSRRTPGQQCSSGARSTEPWAPFFRKEDPGAVLFAEWSACQSQGLHYSNGDSWDRMLRQGIMLLTRFPGRSCSGLPASTKSANQVSSQLPAATTSSLISTPSGNSMESGIVFLLSCREGAIATRGRGGRPNIANMFRCGTCGFKLRSGSSSNDRRDKD